MLMSLLSPEGDTQESPALAAQSCQQHEPPSLDLSLITQPLFLLYGRVHVDRTSVCVSKKYK